MLTPRQQTILEIVVEAHLAEGRPVGSRTIVDRDEVECGPSTVRAELSELERGGYLTHPHTSAGRVPTDSGYRFYVDALLAAERPLPSPRRSGELSRMRREVDEAIRETTTELSRINDLVALVTAPPLEADRIHRIEVLLPRPRVVTVVMITSSGEVAKRTLTFDGAVDHGLVEWASSYLNERLAGLSVGARMIRDRLGGPDLSPVEASFLAEIEPALHQVEQDRGVLYLDGTSRLLSEQHSADLPEAEELTRALEQRVNLLEVLRSALDQRSIFTWIGAENPEPELRGVSMVGANYGLGHRNLGSVGVMGPLRMDYGTAIASVRDAAGELSRFFETVYDD